MADTAPYLAHLLDLPLRPGEAGITKVDAGRAPEPLRRGDPPAPPRAGRASGPLVLVCEDIHWADPASVDVARQLMPLASQLPILFVGALRAEMDSRRLGAHRRRRASCSATR